MDNFNYLENKFVPANDMPVRGKLKNPIGIAFHWTGGDSLKSALNTNKSGEQFGYQYLIDKDGTIRQNVPEGSATWHVLPSKDSKYSNENMFGISLVGVNDKNATPEQLEAAKQLSSYLSERYNIPKENFLGHGQLNPGHRQSDEGLRTINYVLGKGKDMGDKTLDPIEQAILGNSSKTPLSKDFTENAISGNFQPEWLKNYKAPSSLSWSDVPFRAIANVPKSAYEFGSGIAHAVTHPIETGGNVLDIAVGELRKLTPQKILDYLDKIDPNAASGKKAEVMADAVNKFYKDRYGSVDGFKEAVASDPIGVMSDLSAIFSGGSTLAGKVGATGTKVAGVLENQANIAGKGTLAGKLNQSTANIYSGAGKAADVVSNTLEKAADLTNPITAIGKAVGTVGKNVLGMSTGVGGENISRAAKAGLEGDKSFIQNLNKEVPFTQPLEDAKYNLDVMRQNKNAQYRSGIVDIKGDKSILDFNDINEYLDKAYKENRHGTKIKNESTQEHLDRIRSVIDDWKNDDPSIYHTPEGLDALKQKVGSEIDKIPPNDKNSLRVANNIYNSIKGTIVKQAPKYSEVMSDYANASENIREIEKALSLGDKASADAALRKLQSITRNNVNTNYGQRLSLAEQLEKEGGRPFINALAGQSMSSPVARGLAGTLEGVTGLAGLTNPAYLGAIPFQTPSLVGRGLYYGGQLAAPVVKGANVLGVNPANLNLLSNFLNLQTKSREGE